MQTYEEMLRQDLHWGLEEGSLHFEKESAVHRALRKITRKLDEMDVAYAVVGGMALFMHGFERFTIDVNILVTPEGLKKLHEHLEGLGYLPPFPGSKHLRDTELGVKVEFLTTGDYPGDGKPKPIAFPDPAAVSTEKDGIHFLQLPTLIELKLASGMTNPGRLKDLGDVQELIRVKNLPENLADQLHPFVRAEYVKLWQGVNQNPI